MKNPFDHHACACIQLWNNRLVEGFMVLRGVEKVDGTLSDQICRRHANHGRKGAIDLLEIAVSRKK